MPESEGGVRITQQRVYELLEHNRDQLVAVDRKVDLLVQRDEGADGIHADHETRIRALEVWRWKAAGALALLVFFFSAFGYFIAQAVVHR